MAGWRFVKNLLRRLFRATAGDPPSSPKPPVKVCRHCGLLVPFERKVCQYCNASFASEVKEISTPATVEQIKTFKPVLVLFVVTALFYSGAVFLSTRLPKFDLVANWWSPASEVLLVLGANNADWTLTTSHYWRLMTYLFLHQNPLHLFFDMIILAYLGGFTYRNFNARRFWLIVMASAVCGGIFSVSAIFLGVAPFNSVGILPVLFGFLAVNYVHYRAHRQEVLAEELKRIIVWSLILFFCLQFIGIAWIDNLANLGGMLSGLALGLWFASEGLGRWGEGLEHLLVLLGAVFWVQGLIEIGRGLSLLF